TLLSLYLSKGSPDFLAIRTFFPFLTSYPTRVGSPLSDQLVKHLIHEWVLPGSRFHLVDYLVMVAHGFSPCLPLQHVLVLFSVVLVELYLVFLCLFPKGPSPYLLF